MAARAHIPEETHRFGLRKRTERPPAVLGTKDLLVVGGSSGLLGGVVMALPLIIWDWVKAGHIALELPTATTAWLFGLDHFSRTTYSVGPIVVGAAFLGAYWIASGLAFAALADRVYGITTLGASLIAGAVWSFVNFMLFWYMLLPIARGGAPFRATAAAPGDFVAPNWVWILAFTSFGLATGLFYAALRSPERKATDMGMD